MSTAGEVSTGIGILIAIVAMTINCIVAYMAAEKRQYGLVAVFLWVATFNAGLFFWGIWRVTQ